MSNKKPTKRKPKPESRVDKMIDAARNLRINAGFYCGGEAMSKTKQPAAAKQCHTPGPWRFSKDSMRVYFTDASGEEPPICDMEVNDIMAIEDRREVEANAARIVACVNACDGISDPAEFIRMACALVHNIQLADECGEPQDETDLALRMAALLTGENKQ